MNRTSAIAAACLTLTALSGCTGQFYDAPVPVDAAHVNEAEIAEHVSRMSLERKVAQIIMPDISTITPDDMRAYRFGTILNGGNSGPGGNDQAPAEEWLALADAFWEASMEPLPGDEPVIPYLWATDAVHGHSNIPGATIFPHNIGLGATRDADLMQRIGTATAAEIAVTGIDWTFAPTLAVGTDDRWGRTYESFAEEPGLVSELGEATILGMQGDPASDAFLDDTKVIATAKHFFGDGGTSGKDRGDTRGDLAMLKQVHGAPYGPAIGAGVQSVMASFSSINGAKMHGSGDLLTGYLRDDLHFPGLVVGDWNGHGELEICSNNDCPEALLAGLDVYMIPEDWKALFENLVAQVRDGTIPMARLDEAVSRVLRVKQAYGLFDKPKPSERALAGKWDMLGSPEHRAIAREAVRKSLVLLKNDGTLPLKSSANILVAGKAADSIAVQSGGWSITWQGGGELQNADFPGATSIYAGLADATAAGGGSATLSIDGSYRQRPDAAIVVFGEQPYAEFTGDREDHALRDEEGLELLRRFDEQGIPTVAVLLSGRPLWMNRELELADAFIAAWLPGSEGQGIADVLITDRDGNARHDFTGRLSFGWPASCAPDGQVMFDFGTGWSYDNPPPSRSFTQQCSLLDAGRAGKLRIFERGLGEQVSAAASDGGGSVQLVNLIGRSSSGALTVSAFDYLAQEDARRVRWDRTGRLSFTLPARFQPQASASLVMTYAIEKVPAGTITLEAECADCDGSLDLTSTFRLGAGKGWRTARIPLTCLAPGAGAQLTFASQAPVTIDLSSISITPESFESDCDGPF
jgi:beta-glucosidase